MISPRQAIRLIHINTILVRNGLDEIILATHLFRPVRWVLLVLSPWRWFRSPIQDRGRRIRQALEELGPIFVKFGQMLSTRRDLLADDIAVELAKLQDRVPPFPGSQARAIIERAYGHSVEEAFGFFDEEPLASASIAQVHIAQLKDGREVVVKVLRPDIEREIQRDIGLLHTIARLAERFWKDGRRLRPREVVAEYEKTILDELDLMREAASASLLRRNFLDSGMLYIPEVYWSLTRTNVMVMERIQGIPVADIQRMKAAGADLKVLAERGVEIFFTQVFEHNFFHADMHPGNIFVNVDNPRQPHYIAVDFGIMGSLSPDDQRYLAENLLAFFHRDYRRVAELHVLSEWVPSHTRVDEFEAAIRSVCEPIFEKPFNEISFGHLLLRLFQTARRFNMEIQPQLVLLEKTLLYIEGLGRQIYPQLDLWQTGKPFMERWMKEQLGVRAFIREVRTNAPRWGEILPALPALAHDVLQQAREGKLKVEWNSKELVRLRYELRRNHQRTVLAIIGASLVISAAILLGLDGFSPTMVFGLPFGSWLMGGLGLVILTAAWPSDYE
ncbi:MAG: ubiquinone biosynthesis regulatory protein kinase UbiB [Gammaproteobacteria bacterium]|nr:ubiquinone biosynthesis regulatory protein kinase UbiB [Gammaproteobacteria bacterium]